MKRWRADPTEENFWSVVVAYAGVKFKTYSGLPFSYEVRKGKNGEYTKELWIDRRKNSKSLAWSSVLLALGNRKEKVVDRPKALGDIRGVTYIFGMFYRFGLIDVPDEVQEKMKHLHKGGWCHPHSTRRLAFCRGCRIRQNTTPAKGALPGRLSPSTAALKTHRPRLRSAAMKAPVGLLSGRTVCDSRWRGLAPTSSTNVSKLLRRKK